MCTMHVNIIRSQCTRVPRSGEEANLSSPVSSHVHRESPSTLRRCTSPSLSLSLSLSALLPGSIGLLLMCLLTSVRRLGVADARNQSRPELGERAAQSPLLRGKVVSATLGVGGRKRCSFTLDLSVCPSAKMISELGVMYRHASQAIRQGGRGRGRARRAYHSLARRGAATSLHRARANIAFRPEPQPRGPRCPIASEDP